MVNFSKNEATCRTEKTTWGSAVMNHTYKTLNASNFVSCVLKCDEESQCRSCNFWWNKLECELNYAATYSAAISFIRKVNCVHRDMDWDPGTYNNLNYHMTRTAPRAISLENHKRQGPVWGPYRRRSDRAGKTRTALLEMRTALLETSTAKSMQVNEKKNFVAAKVCSLQNEPWNSTFWERILLSRRIVPCRTTSSVANSLRKQKKEI